MRHHPSRFRSPPVDLQPPHAYKLSQLLFNDLAQLKCSYDDDCFHTCKLDHVLELSQIFRCAFPHDTDQETFSLQRMTATVLHCQLNKKQQCANWSKRPMTQAMKDYAAMDVIVMIDIYERLNCSKEAVPFSIDLDQITLYPCACQQRFVTSKARTKHARSCGQNQVPYVSHSRGRGYLPPALRRAHQIVFHEQVRCSSVANEMARFEENRPPDAQFFLEDDDTEVAQAFGLHSSVKPHQRIAAYPPKVKRLHTALNENALLDRLKDDFDSQPEFHCHLFGLGGRGRPSFTDVLPFSFSAK